MSATHQSASGSVLSALAPPCPCEICVAAAHHGRLLITPQSQAAIALAMVDTNFRDIVAFDGKSRSFEFATVGWN